MASTDRLLDVLRLLGTPGGQTLRALATRFGVSKGAIQRDIDHLSRQQVPVREERNGQTLRFFLESGTAPSLPPANPTRELPLSALAVLHPWRRSGWFRGLGLAADAPSRLAMLDATGPEPRSTGGRLLVQAVELALAQHRHLRLTYQGRDGHARKRATVEPLRLRVAQGLAYLDAHLVSSGEPRTYALHRCIEARVLKATFLARAVPPRSAFGAVEGQPVAVHVRFQAAVAGYITERVWHPSQRIETHADGSLDWYATVSGREEFIGWVMSWSPWAELVSPDDWRASLVDRAQALLRTHHPTYRQGRAA